MTPALDQVAQRIARAGSVVVLTGAGISAESGLSTFRGPDGWWRGLDPQQLATPGAFRRDPALVQTWCRERIASSRAAQPNAGHRALARLAERVRLVVVTQNVDDLHERAGSRDVLHLHGRLDASRCADCAAPTDLTAGDPVVACPACGGAVRPGVVWFGEALDAPTLDRASQEALDCDVLLSVGTSGVVYPAAAIPGTAAAGGAFVVEVNPEPSAIAATAEVLLGGTAGTLLPDLFARVQTLLEAAR
jgi:NAD-dependent deacetylase